MHPILPWAVQVEGVTNSVADDAWIDTSSCIIVSKVCITHRHLLVVAREAADKHSGVTTCDSIESKASRLKTLVRYFKYFSLLGVQPHRFHRGHVEEGWIEVLRRTIEEISSHNVKASWTFKVLMEVRVDVETILRYLGRLT